MTAALIVAVGGAIVVGLGLIVWAASSRDLPLIGERGGSATPQGLTSSNVGLPEDAEAAGAETTPAAAGGRREASRTPRRWTWPGAW